jgi:hypothetical protein
MLALRISAVRIVLHALPCESFSWSSILLILTAIHSVMGVILAPMLLAQGTVQDFFGMRSLKANIIFLEEQPPFTFA